MARGLLHHEDLVILVIGLCKHMKPLFMLFTMYVLHVAIHLIQSNLRSL